MNAEVQLRDWTHGNNDAITRARRGYLEFLTLCQTPEGAHRLTPASEPTAFATCFWVYGMHLLRRNDMLVARRGELSRAIRDAVRSARKASARNGTLQSKSYRQLLAFSLSALWILGTIDEDPLEDLVGEQLPVALEKDLHALGCLVGKAQSGNQAMFLAVFLLYARDHLGRDTDADIQTWVDLHLAHMTRFGYWGRAGDMTTLQFQNGYHQYEIFEYLGVDTGKETVAATAAARLGDAKGHFAPYPGGGGCFDYDAVFMLTPNGRIPDPAIADRLAITARTLFAEQRPDGGFAENLYVRPRSPGNMLRGIGHVLSVLPNTAAFMERIRYLLALQRSKYDRIDTHWSSYSRAWSESDLWDSWFRMLALARIQCAVNPVAATEWGFIDFPGIGYHPSLRKEA